MQRADVILAWIVVDRRVAVVLIHDGWGGDFQRRYVTCRDSCPTLVHLHRHRVRHDATGCHGDPTAMDVQKVWCNLMQVDVLWERGGAERNTIEKKWRTLHLSL
jgi:hypothetical protein